MLGSGSGEGSRAVPGPEGISTTQTIIRLWKATVTVNMLATGPLAVSSVPSFLVDVGVELQGVIASHVY